MSQPQRKASAAQSPRGILPARALADFCEKGFIDTGKPLSEGQIQPASLDLRLGEWVYRVRASFLSGPGPGVSVAERPFVP